MNFFFIIISFWDDNAALSELLSLEMFPIAEVS